MAKNAEDRYQSTLGLKHDLETCLYQIKNTGKIEYFNIAQKDTSDCFLIPDKLYGRGAEVQILLEGFERVASNSTSELMLVAGFSGIGKTAVVNKAQLIQSEKMSSLGQLVAGIAHEINNPINFIHGNIQCVKEYTKDLLNIVNLCQQSDFNQTSLEQILDNIDLDFIQKDLPKTLKSMQVGTQRIREIVLSLRNFSRLDEAEIKQVDIHESINSTLLILQHRLQQTTERSEIEVIQDYGQLPLIECHAGQLNQVFLNILTNAIDAIEEKNIQQNQQQIQLNAPQIIIRTKVLDSNLIEIAIKDTGIGMSDKVRQQMFNPFFTTKSVGKGTGMGMSISYQIITKKHGGKLTCISIPNQGTELIIQIPICQ